MNVIVYVKIDQEIGQSLGKVKLHEKTNYMDSYIPKIWQISKNFDRSFLSSINLSFQKSVTWEIKKS